MIMLMFVNTRSDTYFYDNLGVGEGVIEVAIIKLSNFFGVTTLVLNMCNLFS